jgi:hypothetical protein
VFIERQGQRLLALMLLVALVVLAMWFFGF